MVAVVRLLLAVFFVLVSVLAMPSLAAPISDAEQQYRLLSRYMNQYNAPEFDLNGLLFADQRSIKRGLGPRPLRFG
uniref:Neuropeptide F n=1 Tax=Steinernema glaseri TaxID=37863 RepID=A0A1I7YK20_9BILA